MSTRIKSLCACAPEDVTAQVLSGWAVISSHREEQIGGGLRRATAEAVLQVYVRLSGARASHAAAPFPLLVTCQLLCLSSVSPGEVDNDVSVSIRTQPCAIQGLLQTVQEEMDLLHLRENLRRNRIWAESSGSAACCRRQQALF